MSCVLDKFALHLPCFVLFFNKFISITFTVTYIQLFVSFLFVFRGGVSKYDDLKKKKKGNLHKTSPCHQPAESDYKQIHSISSVPFII